MSDLDPLFRELLKKLPQPGAEWSLPARARWLRAMDANINLVLGLDHTLDIVIEDDRIAIYRREPGIRDDRSAPSIQGHCWSCGATPRYQHKVTCRAKGLRSVPT